MERQSVLISGSGIAGPALARCLLDYGLQPTLVERAPAPRTGGYLIDLWGTGYDILGKLGLLDEVRDAGYDVRELRLVNRRGLRVGGYGAGVFRDVTHGRFTTVPRGALSAILNRAIQGRCDITYGDTIASLEQDAGGVWVTFEHGAAKRFDLVIGADGIHSTVRKLAFGPDSDYLYDLGYTVAAFELVGYHPRDENVYVAYTEPDRQVARFSLRGDRTLVLAIMRDPDAKQALALSAAHSSVQHVYLRTSLRGMGWECQKLLDALDDCTPLYLDRMSQVRMERWSNGRVALLGDAAGAISLVAGQGAALAITAAYVLAGELARATSPHNAFAAYEALLLPLVADKQRDAESLASSFAPKTRLGIAFRNQVSKFLGLPFIARHAIGRMLVDDLALPDYNYGHWLDDHIMASHTDASTIH